MNSYVLEIILDVLQPLICSTGSGSWAMPVSSMQIRQFFILIADAAHIFLEIYWFY